MKTSVCKVLATTLMVTTAIGLSACSTTGTAVGELKEPAGNSEPVTLVWKSNATDPDRGSIHGTLPGGMLYSGSYFEVIDTAPADIYADAWDGWRPFWPGWRSRWYTGPIDQLGWHGFVQIYTGRVIANLKSGDGKTHMRCRFSVDDPRAGLNSGGHGDCQLSNGEAIDHVVVAAS